MYDLYDYESKRLRYREFINEAEKERMIKANKKSSKPSRHIKPGSYFLTVLINLYFHSKKENRGPFLHNNHSIEV